MGFNIHLGKDDNPVGKKYVVWEATSIGKTKAEEYSGPTVPKFNVLATLINLGPSNVEEIAAHAKMGKDTVLFHLQQLAQAQYVKQSKISAPAGF